MVRGRAVERGKGEKGRIEREMSDGMEVHYEEGGSDRERRRQLQWRGGRQRRPMPLELEQPHCQLERGEGGQLRGHQQRGRRNCGPQLNG